MHQLFLIIIGFCLFQAANAQNMEHELLVYDETAKIYVNYDAEQCNKQVVGFFLDKSKMSSDRVLNIHTGENFSLFIDNRILLRSTKKNKTSIEPAILPKSANNQPLFCTIVLDKAACISIKLEKVGSVASEKMAIRIKHANKAVWKPLRKPGNERYRDLYVSLFSLILSGVALMRLSRGTNTILSFKISDLNPFKNNLTPHIIKSKINPIDAESLLMLLSVIGTLAVSMALFKLKAEYQPFYDHLWQHFSAYFISFILSLFLIVFCRILMQSVLGRIMGRSKLIWQQFNELIYQFSIYLLILLPFIMFALSPDKDLFSGLYHLFFGTVAVLAVIVLLKDVYLFGFRNIVLFSYICISDLLIVVVSAKVILFS